jgi:hypothetical protein
MFPQTFAATHKPTRCYYPEQQHRRIRVRASNLILRVSQFLMQLRYSSHVVNLLQREVDYLHSSLILLC